MLSRKYLPSFGFFILLITVIFTLFFVRWAFSPFSYEIANQEEQKGHELAKKSKNDKASKHFLRAARIEDNNINRSRRYRCVGSTVSNLNDKIKYFKLAYAYNDKNENAKNELKNILGNEKFEQYLSEKNTVEYVNRSIDRWSIGNNAEILLNIEKDFMYEYQISYFTSNPSTEIFEVVIKLDKEVLAIKAIESNKKYFTSFVIAKGIHDVSISINKTFNPKKLGISKDGRTLGINFRIKEKGVVIDE